MPLPVPHTPSMRSLSISTQAFLTFMLTVFTGSLFDRYGCKPLMATGTILITFGYCMLSLCTKYWQLAICHMTIIPLGINLL